MRMTTNQWRWWWVKLMLSNIMILVYLHRLMFSKWHGILKMNATKKCYSIRANLIIFLRFVFFMLCSLDDHNKNKSIIAVIWFRGKEIKMQIANHPPPDMDRHLSFYLLNKFIISQVTFWLLPFFIGSRKFSVHARTECQHSRPMNTNNGLPFSI